MTCPICRKPAAPAYRPFCSRRCADVDLGRWLTGSYVLPDGGNDAADAFDPDASDRNASDTAAGDDAPPR